MPGLPDILKQHNLQSLNKAVDLLIEFKFCESDFYFLNRSKNCMVATYNFGSVYSMFRHQQCHAQSNEKQTKTLIIYFCYHMHPYMYVPILCLI